MQPSGRTTTASPVVLSASRPCQAHTAIRRVIGRSTGREDLSAVGWAHSRGLCRLNLTMHLCILASVAVSRRRDLPPLDDHGRLRAATTPPEKQVRLTSTSSASMNPLMNTARTNTPKTVHTILHPIVHHVRSFLGVGRASPASAWASRSRRGARSSTGLSAMVEVRREGGRRRGHR